MSFMLITRIFSPSFSHVFFFSIHFYFNWNSCTGTNCTPPAIDDFPSDLFTRQQRQAGGVAIHITVSLYLFLALAVVCDKYFVPAVERISQGKLLSAKYTIQACIPFY